MAITLNGDSGITNVNGTAAAPAITGTDTDSGMYFGTNTVALSTSGTAALTVNSSQVVSLTNALPVASGGTGLTSAGTLGNVLTSDGTNWTSSALPAGGVTSLNGQTGAITNTSLYAIGSYVIGRPQDSTTYVGGETIAGSSLYSTAPATTWLPAGPQWNLYVGSTRYAPNLTLVNTGTWRCVSRTDLASGNYTAGLWVRIS